MENRLASTTTYPELLELGPGQWGRGAGEEGSTILQVYESGSIYPRGTRQPWVSHPL